LVPPSTERVPAAVTLLSKAFETDPVITYFLSSLNPDQRLGYIAAYFRSLLTAAALNGASFDEVGDWSCCAVWVPPGRHVDNPLTLFQSGLLGMLWKLGLGACWVSGMPLSLHWYERHLEMFARIYILMPKSPSVKRQPPFFIWSRMAI
jgi:hypothetical protein